MGKKVGYSQRDNIDIIEVGNIPKHVNTHCWCVYNTSFIVFVAVFVGFNKFKNILF